MYLLSNMAILGVHISLVVQSLGQATWGVKDRKSKLVRPQKTQPKTKKVTERTCGNIYLVAWSSGDHEISHQPKQQGWILGEIPQNYWADIPFNPGSTTGSQINALL